MGKNEIKLVEYFGIGNGRWVNTDCNEIIFLLSRSSFRWRNGREHFTFHGHWLFPAKFHFLSFDVLSCRARISFSSAIHVKWNPLRQQSELPMRIQCVDKVMFLCYRKKKKIHFYDFPDCSFARIEFCLTLETGNKCIFSFEITFVIRWFFDQSDFEKIEKKMKLN